MAKEIPGKIEGGREGGRKGGEREGGRGAEGRGREGGGREGEGKGQYLLTRMSRKRVYCSFEIYFHIELSRGCLYYTPLHSVCRCCPVGHTP